MCALFAKPVGHGICPVGENSNQRIAITSIILSVLTLLFVFPGCSNDDNPADPVPPVVLNLTVSNQTGTEGFTALFVVTLDHVADRAVIVNSFTRDITTTEGVDYTPVVDLADTIAVGDSSTVVLVATIDDDILDSDLREEFELVVSVLSGATAVDTIGLGTIIDDEVISFATNVKPLLQDNCAIPTCHGSGSVSGGMTLGDRSYDSVLAATGNITSSVSPNGLAIVPGEANQSTMYRKTLETGDPLFPGGARMPSGQVALTQDQKQLLADWINQGASDN